MARVFTLVLLELLLLPPNCSCVVVTYLLVLFVYGCWACRRSACIDMCVSHQDNRLPSVPDISTTKVYCGVGSSIVSYKLPVDISKVLCVYICVLCKK